MKLGVVYPWFSPFMFTDFVDSALNIEPPEGCEVKWFRGKGWCPAKRHIAGCERALEWGAELIVILGSDQTYEPDLFKRLVGRFNEGYEVVTALVPCRGYVDFQPMRPFQPMAWRFKPDNGNSVIRPYRGMKLDMDMLEIIEPGKYDDPMQAINFIGSGVVMFHRDHILAIKRPWFFEQIDYETQQREANMDCRFIWRLQTEAHAKVWLDTSLKIRHCHVFKIDDSFQYRFQDWKDGLGFPDENICLFTKPIGEPPTEDSFPGAQRLRA